RHNGPFLAALMRHPRFREGRLSTAFIAEEYPDGFHAMKPDGDTARVMTAVATAIDHVLGERKRQISGQMAGRTVTRERRRVVRLADAEHRLEVERDGEAIAVTFPDRKGRGRICKLLSAWKPGDVVWCGTVDGRRVAGRVRPVANGVGVAAGGIEAQGHRL